jgi:hypothetical protein
VKIGKIGLFSPAWKRLLRLYGNTGLEEADLLVEEMWVYTENWTATAFKSTISPVKHSELGFYI